MNFGSNAKLLETLFDTLWDVVFCIKDRHGRYIAVNQALSLRVHAANKQAMIGKQARDFFAADLAQAYDLQDQAVFETGQAVIDQLEQITNPDGTMGWYLTNKFPFLDEQSAIVGVIGVSQDLHTPSDSELSIANLGQVVANIKTNLNQPLRGDELAKLIDLSAEQLDRRMKKVFRLSTKKYIMKCRLEKSAELLRTTDRSLAQIAIDCGFSDQSALTRQFKETFLWTPAAYRQSQRTTSRE
ncbi:MAG: AraC family transcriptional regulator [Planctomycetaceae bacterium]|nr:AraC family transcriptional regulator [Planctomycetaceae bacterium]